MFARSISSRLSQRSFSAARLFGTGAPATRTAPKAIPEQVRPPSSILYVYGIPRTKRHNPNAEFLATYNLAKEMYNAASSAGPVGQITMAPAAKNFGWIEFLHTRDATTFKEKFTEEQPYQVGDRLVRMEYGARRPTLGGVNDWNELAIRYNIHGISSEEAVKLTQEKFPGATVTTNVKSTRGHLGTIFVQLESEEAAKDAFGAYWSDPLVFPETQSECVMPSKPNPELTLYNLKPFAPIEEILEPLKQFGEIVKHVFSFQRHGPNCTGRARIAFNELSQAEALFKATMNEEIVIHDLPVRAEYYMMRYRNGPKPEGASESGGASTATESA